MVRATTDTSAERLFDQLEAGAERSIERTGEDADGARAETLAELVDVVRAIEDLLETVDLERLPDVVEPSALPGLLVPDGVPEAIRERDLDPVLDLGALRDVVNLRALWNTVDIVDFRRELDDLKSELEDVVGPDAFDSAGDSETAADISAFVEGVKPEATNAALQQEAGKAAERARNGVLEGHAKFEQLYESTGRGSGYAGRRSVSNNPTAVSSVPYGPLPTGVSTRVSTVPSNVRYAKIDAPPRIYGRRWRSVPRR